MPPTNGRPSPASADAIELRRGPPPALAKPGAKPPPGKGSRTRFLSVKKFRFSRARSMLLIGVTVVLLVFLAWCGLYLLS